MSRCYQPHQQKASAIPHVFCVNEIVIRGTVVILLSGTPGELEMQINVNMLDVSIDSEWREIKRGVPSKKIRWCAS